MKADVDTSILNSVNIKRFTQSLLEEYGASIDRSDRAKWEVTFPDVLAERLDRESGTLVFDPADRELGSGDLLVQPGTQVFSALLDLVERSGSVGQLELAADDLQANLPAALNESHLDVEMAEFSERTWDAALSFHFRVQFETPSSFHSEEMVTATIDPATQARLPDLTARLTSHLPQLLRQRNEGSGTELSANDIQESHTEAQQAVIDQCRPIVEGIREQAAESASERIDEITGWYEQRRRELDQELHEQREEIQKWQKKRRKARKDSTRRQYIQNRREAEEAYERLQKRIARKKQELDTEETEEIDDVIDRNSVDVDVSLLGVTEIRYVRGTVTIEIRSDFAEAAIEASYLPATDDFHGVDCSVCSADLTAGVLPQLCVNGHLVGDPCSTSCRSCGRAHCVECDPQSSYSECTVCWEDVCERCRTTCASCGEAICPDHAAECVACGEPTCHLCGEACSTCGEFHCDDHLRRCPTGDALHCTAHILTCVDCDTALCETHIGICDGCGDPVCPEHGHRCDDCGETFCARHVELCGICSADQEDGQHGYCSSHAVRCAVGGTVICTNHRKPRTIGPGFVCPEHHETCPTCKVAYSTNELTDGQCSACRSIGEVEEKAIPEEIRDMFRSVSAGGNEAYLVILGKKRFRRNKVVVFDRQSGTVSHWHSAGLLKQLTGQYR